MAASGGTQQSFRKALGALKDSTKVGLAQLNSDYKVALKTLVVVHRAMREVDPTFREELINYSWSRGLILNVSHFRDDSSTNAWDYSAWVCNYALYLEERQECLHILKYDVQTDHSRTKDLDTVELLEQLPALQQLLFRLLACQRHDAVRALEIYKEAGNQAESLSELLEICRGLGFGHGQKYIKIEQPPASFMTAMEDYVKDAPQILMLPWRPE